MMSSYIVSAILDPYLRSNYCNNMLLKHAEKYVQIRIRSAMSLFLNFKKMCLLQ
jgi:hypothetical protein